MKMPNKFDKQPDRTQQPSRLNVSKVMAERILSCVECTPPHPTGSTNEERVAYLTTMHIREKLLRVLDDL
jgi:hypothetical protein